MRKQRKKKHPAKTMILPLPQRRTVKRPVLFHRIGSRKK